AGRRGKGHHHRRARARGGASRGDRGRPGTVRDRADRGRAGPGRGPEPDAGRALGASPGGSPGGARRCGGLRPPPAGRPGRRRPARRDRAGGRPGPAVTALIRYQAGLLLRSHRWVGPVAVYAVFTWFVGAAAQQPLSDGLRWSAAALVPLVAWLTRS